MTLIPEVDVIDRSPRELGHVVVDNMVVVPTPAEVLLNKQILLFPLEQRTPSPVYSETIENPGYGRLRLTIWNPSGLYVGVMLVGVDYSGHYYQIVEVSIGTVTYEWQDHTYRLDIGPGLLEKRQGITAVTDTFGNVANKSVNDLVPVRWAVRLVGNLSEPTSTHEVEVSADLLI